jgi:hypothetical protein
LGKLVRFLCKRSRHRPAIFAQSKPSRGEPPVFEMSRLSGGRRFIMDYVVVFFTMLMIAGYACIIERALRGTE